jgi:hypothetical protein
VYAQLQRRGGGGGVGRQGRARLPERLHEEGVWLVLMLMLHNGPVPRRQQRRHVCHSSRCSLKLRPPPPHCNNSAPAREPLRARLETGAVLLVRHTAVAALRWGVAAAAAAAAAAPEAVVVQLVLAGAAPGAAAAHGHVSEAPAGAGWNPAADQFRLQLPPSVGAVAVLAHAARGGPHVVAVAACAAL